MLAVLYLQHKGFRYIEALVITLIVTIATCFAAELIFSKPNLAGVLLGFIPRSANYHEPGDALRQHRHHRRDGDAA